jgi:transcriptional regulator with XRE-family HTH domain
MLGDRIKAARELRGMGQEELAHLIGKHQKQIWEYEANRVQPSAAVVAAIAKELETTTDYLLGLTDNPVRVPHNVDELSPAEQELLQEYRSKDAQKRRQVLDIVRVI